MNIRQMHVILIAVIVLAVYMPASVAMASNKQILIFMSPVPAM